MKKEIGKRQKTLRIAAAIATVVAGWQLLPTRAAFATNGTWSTNADGSWAISGNWSGGDIADGTDATADFSTVDITADRTVTLDGARTIGTVTFGDATTPSHNWILNTGSGGPLTLGGSSTINVVNQTATINAVIDGNAGLTKTGAGTLVLGGANIYSGGTTVSNGTLTAAHTSALGAGNVSVSSGTLELGNAAPLAVSTAGTYTQNSTGTTKVNVSSISSHSSLTASNYNFNGTLDIAGGSDIAASNTASGAVFEAGTRTDNSRFSNFNYDSSAFGPGKTKAWDTSRVDQDPATVTNGGKLKVVNFYEGFENANGNTWTAGGTLDQFKKAPVSYVFHEIPNPTFQPGTATITNVARTADATKASANTAYGTATATDNNVSTNTTTAFTAHVGPATDFGGYNNGYTGSFTGFTAQTDVFLDPAHWSGTGNGTGFDWSVAASNPSGNHRRDFIFHLQASGGTLYATANGNSAYMSNSSLAGYTQIADVPTDGAWYTLQHVFRQSGNNLYVDLHLLDSTGTSRFDATLNNVNDIVSGDGQNVAGNNYGWFVNIDTGDSILGSNSLRIDNVKMLNTPVLGGAALFSTSLTGVEGSTNVNNALPSFDIGGTIPAAAINGYDVLNSTGGTLTLSGNLALSLVNGFVPAATDSFTILSASSVSGNYANALDGSIVQTSDGRGQFLVDWQTLSVGGGQRTQLVLSNFQVLPEPASAGILLLAGAMTMGRRRRYP